MADYSGCRSRNTRGVFPAPSSCHRFLGVWSTPGKYFRGGTLLLSNETIANRRLRSQPVSDMAIYRQQRSHGAGKGENFGFEQVWSSVRTTGCGASSIFSVSPVSDRRSFLQHACRDCECDSPSPSKSPTPCPTQAFCEGHQVRRLNPRRFDTGSAKLGRWDRWIAKRASVPLRS